MCCTLDLFVVVCFVFTRTQATGFSFFIDTCFDDPGKMLALSLAVALATPFENGLIGGQPLAADAVVVVSFFYLLK